MSLKKWAYLAEIGSAIAVVASLIYVGYELNQNTNAVRAGNYQALLDYADGAELILLENADAASVVVRAESDYDSLTKEEKRRFGTYAQNVFNFWEAAYLYQRQGLLAANVWQTANIANRAFLKGQAYLEYWDRNHDAFTRDFAAYVDGIIEQGGYR